MTVYRPQRKTRSTSGAWYFRFWKDGVLHERGGYATKLRAKQAEWERRNEVGARSPWHQPPAGAGPDAALADYAARWLDGLEEAVQRGELAPRTLQSYRESYDRHLLPMIGRRPLAALTRPLLLGLLDGKRRGGLSKNSVRILRSALSSLLTDALERGDLTAHPLATGGRRRRGQPVTEAERVAAIRPMTREQRDRFLDARGSGPYGVLFELLAKTGLRPGEAFALQVGDVDLERGVLHVARAWDGTAVRPTKTHATRVVDLTEGLVERLRQHIVATTGPQRDDDVATRWLLNSPRATFQRRKVIARFRAILRAAGLPRFRLYDLRHTYASLRIADGAPITYVAQQLGHQSPGTTLRHYARWAPTHSRAWVERDFVAPVQGRQAKPEGVRRRK